MAENVTLARPYAEAAFKLARESRRLPAWDRALQRMALVASDAAMQGCIADPMMSQAQRVRLFVDVADGELDDEHRNFLRVLAENDRLTLLPEILGLFRQLKATLEGVRDVFITSAFPLDDAAAKALLATLGERFPFTLNPTVRIDRGLIGGVIVSVGDEVIDASVRGKLVAMSSALRY
jgi:F-type H+-transporting ATPase subunit delta